MTPAAQLHEVALGTAIPLHVPIQLLIVPVLTCPFLDIHPFLPPSTTSPSSNSLPPKPDPQWLRHFPAPQSVAFLKDGSASSNSPTMSFAETTSLNMSTVVLVTGATGLLGRQVFNTFKSSGCLVVGQGYSRANPPTILKADLEKPDDIHALLDDVK